MHSLHAAVAILASRVVCCAQTPSGTGQDSVEAWELSKFVMHFVADILADAASLDDDPADQGPKVRHTPLAPR